MADPELDESVRQIVELMLADKWEPGPSHWEFARKYKVQTVTVRRWASEASRFIRLCVGDEHEIRDELLRSIRRVGRGAERDGDYRSANGSLELACKVHGLLERKRPEDGGNEPVPVEQLAAALRALGHEVKLNDASRPEPASPGATSDTERPEPEAKQRIEGLLDSDDE